MSLQTRLSDLLTRVGTEFKTIRTLISGSATGDVSGLTTTATDLVAAVNEVKVTADAGSAAAAALINDGVAGAATTYSSNKITADISAAVSALVGGAPGALDTLNELAAALNDDAAFNTTITNSLALKANIADTYSQTELGDPETDLVALFNAALV